MDQSDELAENQELQERQTARQANSSRGEESSSRIREKGVGWVRGRDVQLDMASSVKVKMRWRGENKVKSTLYKYENTELSIEQSNRVRDYFCFLNIGRHLGQYHLPLGLVCSPMQGKWNHSMGQSWLSHPIISP